MDVSTALWSILLLEKIDVMGLAGRGARNAQMTLAGEGTGGILHVTSNFNLFKLTSMRLVAAPHGLAAGLMAVFEAVGIDAGFFPDAAGAQYLASISVSPVTAWRRSPSGLRQDDPGFQRQPRSAVLLRQRSAGEVRSEARWRTQLRAG
jgi:hypothetical protein